MVRRHLYVFLTYRLVLIAVFMGSITHYLTCDTATWRDVTSGNRFSCFTHQSSPEIERKPETS